VPTDEAPQILLQMGMEQGMFSAVCPHCLALNTFLVLDSIGAYICRECGHGVSIEGRVQ
jgi:hypothetical protein